MLEFPLCSCVLQETTRGHALILSECVAILYKRASNLQLQAVSPVKRYSFIIITPGK